MTGWTRLKSAIATNLTKKYINNGYQKAHSCFCEVRRHG